MNTTKVPIITNNQFANLVGVLLVRLGGKVTITREELERMLSGEQWWVSRSYDPATGSITFSIEELGHGKH